MDTAMAKGQVKIFEKNDELLCLAQPLLCFLPVLLLQIRGAPMSSAITWSSMMAAYLGLNLIHTGFTFPLLSFPEIKAWSAEQLSVNRKNVSLSLVIMFLFLVIYFQVEGFLSHRAFLDSEAKWGATLLSGIIIVHFVFTEKHSLGHSFGLSGLYNRQLCNRFAENSSERKRILAVERWEQRIFGAYLIIVLVALGATLSGISLTGQRYYFLLIVAITLVLNALPFLCPGYSKSNKKYFQLRFFLYPLVVYFPLCFPLLSVKHGMESLFVYRKILSKSKVEDRARKVRLTYLACTVVGVLGLFSFKQGIPGFAMAEYMNHPGWFNLLGGLSLAITFFHFHVDGMLYHFSDPITRKHISALVN